MVFKKSSKKIRSIKNKVVSLYCKKHTQIRTMKNLSIINNISDVRVDEAGEILAKGIIIDSVRI